MDIMELLQDILQMIIFTVITGCGIVIVKKVLDYLNSKIDEVQATTQLADCEKLNQLIDYTQLLVTDIVTSINQVFVSSLKQSGKFDKESATIAKNTAVDKAKELLTDETIIAIESVYGDLDSYLDILIESTVNKLKESKTN